MNAEEYASGKLVLDFPAEAVGRLRLNNPDKRNAARSRGPGRHRGRPSGARPRHRDALRRRSPARARRSRPATTSARSRPRASSGTPRRWSPIRSPPRWTRSRPIPIPSSARSTGTAWAAASSWPSAVTFASAPTGAKLGMPPAKLGLIYGHTGLERFMDVIGVAATRDLFLTGRVVDAEKALRIGLVTELADDDELEDASVALAAEIAGNAPLSMTGQQARDRGAGAKERALARGRAGSGGASRVVLCVRGLPRGRDRLRREAKAGVAWPLSSTRAAAETVWAWAIRRA